jgi:hypothetical protein
MSTATAKPATTPIPVQLSDKVVYQQLAGNALALRTGSNAPHHTTMRGYGHDSASWVLPARDSGAPGALR